MSTISPTSLTHTVASINRSAALDLLQAARAASTVIGIEVTIAITDAGGHLTALERSDIAPFLTVNVAIDKAWSAVSFGLPTHVWSSILQNNAVAQLAHQPRLVAVGGGYPIIKNGQVVGGIGISGGNALQDQQAAEAALKALGFDLLAN
ncbi:heme-binding protein [Undibacterium sp.]|uniref:GlcG/HbpS family heme-binding protein n=1 Tax=Undibacterium sp. TaxID=1914977 RepID=UPI00374CF1A4